MNGLLSKVLPLLILIFGGVIQGHAVEKIRMGFSLPTHSQQDRDLRIVQNFLFFHVFSEIEEDKKEGCCFIPDIEGQLFIEGPSESLVILSGAFGLEMEKLMNRGMTPEDFSKSKERYLASFNESEALYQKNLAEEITWDNVEEAKESLHLIKGMLQHAAPSLAEKIVPEIHDAPVEITLVSNTPNYQLFYQLPLSDEEQQSITKLIKKLADTGYMRLLLKEQGKMDELGDKVILVHPLRFIGYIFTNPSLKRRMSKIMWDFLGQKRRGFLHGHGKKEGFAKRMTKEANNKNLMQYLPGFAQSLGITVGSIEPYFYRHDWEGLLDFLLN